MTDTIQDKLLDMAYEARGRAYVPYSNYRVGACLMTADGKLYQGANLENAGFTPTVCAERTAFFKAVYEGERDFAAIAVVSDADEPGFPCGVCRQVMAEFVEDDFIVITADRNRNATICRFDELLPHAFGPRNLLK